MATLEYVDEDGNHQKVSGLDTIRDGSLVGADIDADDVEDIAAEIESTKKKMAKAESGTADVDPDDWPLKTVTPSAYLKKSPTGPQAKIAQQMVDAGHGDVLAGDDDSEDDED